MMVVGSGGLITILCWVKDICVDCQSTVNVIVFNGVGFAILVICKLLFLKRIMATFANAMTRRRIKMKSYTFFTMLVTNGLSVVFKFNVFAIYVA